MKVSQFRIGIFHCLLCYKSSFCYSISAEFIMDKTACHRYFWQPGGKLRIKTCQIRHCSYIQFKLILIKDRRIIMFFPNSVFFYAGISYRAASFLTAVVTISRDKSFLVGYFHTSGEYEFVISNTFASC